ncbi:MAG: ABC transporter substrate-binding protein [Coriobacteriales bacterium]|nr:ABC transporter substrate-binding protein [Coriobacteriales bacterium]
MKQLKKSWILGGLACLCALCLVLAGCGGSSESTSESDTSSTDSSATTEEATSDSSGGWYSSAKETPEGYKLVEDGTLIGASDMAYPPLESVVEGKAGEYEGFEIDLVTEVASRLGLKMKWLNPMKFDTIIPLIKQGGKADVGVSSFTITDERKQEIDFSDSYIDSNQAIVMKKGSDKKGADEATTQANLNAEGVTIMVQQGTTGEAWVKENLPKAECKGLDNADDCLNNLVTDKCTAVVADLPCMSYYCKESFTDCEVAAAIPTGEQYGIVVSKDNAKLTEDINKALAEMKSDGTIDKFMEKWFGGNI